MFFVGRAIVGRDTNTFVDVSVIGALVNLVQYNVELDTLIFLGVVGSDVFAIVVEAKLLVGSALTAISVEVLVLVERIVFAERRVGEPVLERITEALVLVFGKSLGFVFQTTLEG